MLPLGSLTPSVDVMDFKEQDLRLLRHFGSSTSRTIGSPPMQMVLQTRLVGLALNVRAPDQ